MNLEKVRPDSHREEVSANCGRKLGNRVTEDVACDGASEQFVDESRGRDHEHGDEQRGRPKPRDALGRLHMHVGIYAH